VSGRRIKISTDESLLGAPEERPRVDFGVRRRVVRMIPIPLPGGSPVMRPAIWTSPTKHFEKASGKEVISHVVLLRRGPPVDIAVVNVVADEVENCPMGIVECEETLAVDSIATLPNKTSEPLRGSLRTVPLLPIPGGVLCPCIWLSPYEIPDDDLMERVSVAVLLLNPGPPKPEIVAVRVPSSTVAKFMTGPVNW
jgi:hypothetical protein